MTKIDMKANVYNRNQEMADALRSRFTQAKTYVINIVSSPGSGKTSLIEQMAPRLMPELNLFVIDGDVETQCDAIRLQNAGIPAVQIETHGSCHLDVPMVEKALTGIELANIDLLIIENIGNLICPVGFDLGEHLRVVMASLTEGEDKPMKYPQAYRKAQVCVFNKIDLAEFIPFDMEKFQMAAKRANENIDFFDVSCTKGNGIDQWCSYIKDKVRQHKSIQP